MDITSLTAVELGKKIKAKEISVVEAVKASIAQIEKVEKDVNSFVTLDKEGALKRAEEVQKLIDDGTLTGPLAGVPVAIKDNMCTKGMEQLFWERRTWMNLPWEVRQRLLISDRQRTRGI